MGEKPDQIERHIQHQRSELEDNISELEEKVKSAFDWRTQFHERPGIMLGAAFLGGAVVSALLPSTSSITSKLSSRRRTSRDPWTPYTNRQTPDTSRETAPHLESHSTGSSYPSGNTASKTSETWENLKNAAIGMATTRISQFIEELVPGFSEHYNKAASGRPATPFSAVPSAGGSGTGEKNWQKPNGGSDYTSHS
ncbi:MAG TPA: DUF3618 domain-containing protein [Candidatus Acidoferrum sp.]|jgi:hypothetical protein|nr:DUF3618 domain-containing protein [Candidatus Acidoferrum sp.]